MRSDVLRHQTGLELTLGANDDIKSNRPRLEYLLRARIPLISRRVPRKPCDYGVTELQV